MSWLNFIICWSFLIGYGLLYVPGYFVWRAEKRNKPYDSKHMALFTLPPIFFFCLTILALVLKAIIVVLAWLPAAG